MGVECLAAAIGGVGIGRTGKGDVVVPARLDEEVDGDFFEEGGGGALSSEVIADGENELVGAGRGIGEEGGIAAAIAVGEGICEDLAALSKADADSGGGVA